MKNKLRAILFISILSFTLLTLTFTQASYAASSTEAIKEVLIDPGHSPQKPGATSCIGEKEYVYNNSLASVVQQVLRNAKIPYALTRTPMQDVSLLDRARQAQGKKLFISLHHDSVQPQYIQNINAQPHTTKASGYSIFVSRKNKYFDQSLKYAIELGNRMRAMGYLPSTHHGEKIKGENRQLLDAHAGVYAFDVLVVLKHADSPALLFEAGVLPNPEDEKLVRSARYKRNIASAIADMARRGE